jgi:penicillin amidase
MAGQPHHQRWRLMRWAAAGLLLLVAGAGLTGWWALRASLPRLTGVAKIPGLSTQVTVERDANGIPTIRANTREDLARALGFLHAQDRFFEMDLLRRSGAGELSELFGPGTLELDVGARRHRFRHLASETLRQLTAEDLRELDAYVAGVNAGLDALSVRPWEYLVLRRKPRPWTREDSVVVLDAMTISLQEGTGAEQRSRLAIADTYGMEMLAFLRPQVLERTAALDGSLAAAPPVPDAAAFKPRPSPEPAAAPPPSAGAPKQTELTRQIAAWLHGPADAIPGSNSFALAGNRVQGGGALVANDMHLGLSVPSIWYRVAMRSPDRTFTGVSLPGAPCPIVGSNGEIAWGLTDAYIGWSDVIIIEPDPADRTRYRVPDGSGWEKFQMTPETVAVAGRAPVTIQITSTRWGPLLTEPGAPGRVLALHWMAYEPVAGNFRLGALADARSVDEALAITRQVAIPAENLIVGDRAGNIAWTLIGRVPRRVGFDGWLPVSWADGSKHWDGYLPPGETPTVRNPPDGQLWTANNRVVGGDFLQRIGDAGYDDPARAGQIRDDLTRLGPRLAVPADLLAIQLDDASLFLARWRDLLLKVLTDDAVRAQPRLAEMRRLILAWDGHASINASGHRLVRSFRGIVAKLVLNPIYAPVRARYSEADFGARFEQPLWSILSARPAYLLTSTDASWDALLLRAASLTAKIGREEGGGRPLADYTWGKYNTLRMRHPLSGAFPEWIAARLDMLAQELPGDVHMPRVQGPAFGASERMDVSPGREGEGIFHQPGGASGHPLSPFYRAGHEDWVRGSPTPFLPGDAAYRLVLQP